MKGETEENCRACADFPERHFKCRFWVGFIGFSARAVIHQQLFKFSIKTGGRRSEAPPNPTTVKKQFSHIFLFLHAEGRRRAPSLGLFLLPCTGVTCWTL